MLAQSLGLLDSDTVATDSSCDSVSQQITQPEQPVYLLLMQGSAFNVAVGTSQEVLQYSG